MVSDRLWPECNCLKDDSTAHVRVTLCEEMAHGWSMGFIDAAIRMNLCPDMIDATLAQTVAQALTANEGTESMDYDVYKQRVDTFIRKLRVATLAYIPEEGSS